MWRVAGFCVTAEGTREMATTYEHKGVTSEIVIPLLSCILIGIGITTALTVAQWGIIGIALSRALQFGAGSGALAASLAITWRFYQAVVWFAEEQTDRDLDQDGVTGQPAPEPEPRIITVRSNNGGAPRSQYDQMREQMEEFVRGCEVDTSMRRWEPRIGRGRYMMFRAALMDAGHADWVTPSDKRQGWKLTAPADKIIDSFN